MENKLHFKVQENMKQLIIIVSVIMGLFGLLVIWNKAYTKNKKCSDPYNIQILPFKNERIDDITYNELVFNKEFSVPCLVEEMLDIRKMQDPRQAPPYDGFVVGDASFMVLLHIINKPLRSFLPKNIQGEFDQKGIYAYFDYVKKDSNRKELQNNMRYILENQCHDSGDFSFCPTLAPPY